MRLLLAVLLGLFLTVLLGLFLTVLLTSASKRTPTGSIPSTSSAASINHDCCRRLG